MSHKPHLLKAHQFWKEHLLRADTVVDATCGNGWDTAVLAQLVPQGHVYSLDIQEEALESARKNAPFPNITFLHQSHILLPQDPKIKLFVYNLGYLPGGNKQLTTETETTLKSIQIAYDLLSPNGALSITCYPGHPEGALEEKALQIWSQNLPSAEWSTWKSGSPTLLIVTKNI